jgi:hypothetical protein
VIVSHDTSRWLKLSAHLGVVLGTVTAAGGVETDDLVTKDIRARSQGARDLHGPGKAVLCTSISIGSIQQRRTATN